MLLLTVALQQVRAAEDKNAEDDNDDNTEIEVKPSKKPLEVALDAITLPDKTSLATGTFETIGLFLLVAGVVALVAHILLGLDTAKKYYYPDPYPYTAPT